MYETKRLKKGLTPVVKLLIYSVEAIFNGFKEMENNPLSDEVIKRLAHFKRSGKDKAKEIAEGNIPLLLHIPHPTLSPSSYPAQLQGIASTRICLFLNLPATPTSL